MLAKRPERLTWEELRRASELRRLEPGLSLRESVARVYAERGGPRRWTILVCELCEEHVSECTCDPDEYRLDWPNLYEPPTKRVTVVEAD